MRRVILALALLPLLNAATAAQSQPPARTAPPAPPRFEEQVEIVGVTPIHGVGVPRLKIPSNVQVFSFAQLRTAAVADVPSLLTARAASVHVNDTQAGTFQPDIVFRGFGGSPLLGASEGLAVYQDGVRLNDPFGDTINWDALPSTAIASINLLPGSNPLFGLNALGGALSLRTKNGFEAPGRRGAITGGSFGRATVEAEAGGHSSSLAYYTAGALTRDGGWRDFSPSTVRRLFADIAWKGAASALDVSLTAASNDLTGNASAPIGLLDEDRSAIFTHSDRTANDVALITGRGSRFVSASLLLEGVVYTRLSSIETFNGDAADDDDPIAGELGPWDAVNNISATSGRGAGATGQVTRTAPLLQRTNHLIAGGGIDVSRTRFTFGSELAMLTPDRGTIGSGLFDDDEDVSLEARTATASLFVADTWSASPRVSISASARLNRSTVRLRDQIGTALDGDHAFVRLNPAAGVTIDLRGGINAFASYAESSRVPTPVELTCADPEDPCRLPNAFVSDPPLEQVVARTWEAGLRSAGTAVRAGSVDWSVAGFSTTAADDIIFVSSGTLRGEGHFENVPHTRRAGLEASIGMTLERVTAFGAYTVQRATFGAPLILASPNHPLADALEIAVAAGDRLPGIPAHSGKLGATVAATSRLTLGAAARLQSSHAYRGDEANLLKPVDGFALLDVHARHRLTRRIAATVHITNLFNGRYATFGVLGDAGILGDEFEDDPRFLSPGAPRAAWVGLEMGF